MEYDQLIQKIEAMHRRLATLGHPAGGSAEQDAARLDVQQELSSALEELHEASEELHQQNEELIATRQAVEAERQRYQDLFNFAPDGYLVTNPEGIIQEVNRAAAAALDADQDFLVGKPLLAFVAEEDRKTFHARLVQLRADMGTEQGWEIGLQPRYGTPFRASMTVGKVCDMASQVIGIRWLLRDIWLPRDITERKRAAEALRRANEELEQRVQRRTGEAIENARLYAAEQGRRRRLEAVRAVTEEITRELELAKVLGIIVRRAAELLGVGTGTVWLWDEGEQVLVPRARLHPGEDLIAGRKLRLGEGTAGLVAERKQGLIVNEYQTWPHALPYLVKRGTVTAAMGEPLMYGDRCLGVLVVNNDGTGRTFSEEDGQLLALFASHAAIAIENARLFEEVQAGRERVENLSRKLVEIQEAERRHIARELHDEIGQSLTGLKLLLDMNARVSPEQARENQGDAQAVVNDLLSQVRDLSLELRPAMLDDLGLLSALVWYFERYRTRTNVQVTFKHVGMEGCRFPTEVETAAYRIVQEALTNVARHASVNEVTVRLWAGEEMLGMQIEDRGVGFDPEAALAAHISSGLAGMRERVGLLGGRMAIESAPGAGTCVAAEFPLGGMNRGVEEKAEGIDEPNEHCAGG